MAIRPQFNQSYLAQNRQQAVGSSQPMYGMNGTGNPRGANNMGRDLPFNQQGYDNAMARRAASAQFHNPTRPQFNNATLHGSNPYGVLGHSQVRLGQPSLAELVPNQGMDPAFLQALQGMFGGMPTESRIQLGQLQPLDPGPTANAQGVIDPQANMVALMRASSPRGGLNANAPRLSEADLAGNQRARRPMRPMRHQLSADYMPYWNQ